VAWLLVGLVTDPTDAGHRLFRDPAVASIETADMLALIVSDRPTTTTRHERGNHLRSLPAMVDADADTASPVVLTGDGGFPASPLTVGPLSFGLARRGPPATISR
jgi:hypothetical protein